MCFVKFEALMPRIRTRHATRRHEFWALTRVAGRPAGVAAN